MDEKDNEYNDIESLAAYLHSGRMFSQVDHSSDSDEDAETRTASEKSVDDILFTVDNIKKRPDVSALPLRQSAKSAPDVAAVIAYNADEDEDEYDESRRVKKQKAKKAKAEKPEPASDPAPAADDLSSVLGVGPSMPGKLRSSQTPDPDLTTEEMDLSEEEREEERKREIQNEVIAAYGTPINPVSPVDPMNHVNSAHTQNIEPTPADGEVSEDFDASATRMMNAVGRPNKTSELSEKDSDDSEDDEEMSDADRRRLVQMRRNYERQKQRTRTFAYILLGVFLSIVIVGVSAYGSTFLVKWALDFTGIGAVDFKVDVQIPENAETDAVAAILAENNLITSPQFFSFYADFSDKYLSKPDEPTDYIAGKYTISSTMQYSTIIKTLRREDTAVKTVSVRIAEGMTAHEIGVLLEENNVCFAEDFEQFYKNIQNNYDFERRVKESPSKFNQLEGYLFPDTYDFYVVRAMETGGKPGRGETAEEAEAKMRKESLENAKLSAKKMYSNFNEKMTRAMYKRMGEMNMTLDEVIAIASLVQREAAYQEDMEYVASVFLNRIRNSEYYPYLQSDISILYIENDIKPYITGTDSKKERIYNAYNTYVCKGVPAGPVCNPGLDAINAVLYAPDTNYYYFCANPETGDIYYAENHEQHIANIELAGLIYDPETDRYFESGERFE